MWVQGQLMLGESTGGLTTEPVPSAICMTALQQWNSSKSSEGSLCCVNLNLCTQFLHTCENGGSASEKLQYSFWSVHVVTKILAEE